MGRTREQVRQLTIRKAGVGFFSGTANSSGGSTTTLVDDELKVYFNDRWNGGWLYLTSGSPTLTTLLITDFAQSTGTLTFTPALGAAPNSLTFEILPFSPTEVHDVLVEVLNRLFVDGYVSRETELRGMVAGSPLYNNSFDYWTSTSTPDGWARNGSSTLSKEIWTANTAEAWQALKMTGAADYVALGEPWKRWLYDFKGHTLTLYCRVLTSTASNARLNLNNGSDNYSSYHSGNGDWEVLSVEVATVSTDTDLEPRLYTDTTSAAYFSSPWIEGGPLVREYPLPAPLFPTGPDLVTVRGGGERADQRHGGRTKPWYSWSWQRQVNPDPDTSSVGLLYFPTPPPGGTRLYLRGRAPLSLPSADTGVIEVTEPESELLASLVAAELLRREQPKVMTNLRAIYQLRINQLEADAQSLRLNLPSSEVASLPLRW